MTKHLVSISRRGLIAASMAAAAMAKTVAGQTPEPETDADGDQYLLTAMSPNGDTAFLIGIESYDGELNQIAQTKIEDGVVHYEQTGKSGLVLVTTLFGSQIVDVSRGQIETVDWDAGDPGYIFPAVTEYGRDLNEDYLMAMPTDMGVILLIDLETFSGRDITEYVANNSTDMLAMVPDMPIEGSMGGVWTGDKVYMLDYDNPESAEPMVGDDPEWYSTTLQLSYDGKWATFTTYDPSSRGEVANCYLQNLETGDYTRILEGNAWTTGFFIPNDFEHFIAHNPESGLEYRSIETPDETGEVLAEVDLEGSSAYWLNDGATLLYGHRPDNDSPRNWILVDMESREVTELDDLEGTRPWWPKLAKTRPENLLFITDSNADVPFTFMGLDIANGEVWDAVSDVNVNTLNGVTASQDGNWYTVSSVNRGSNIGVWLIDMVNKNAHKLDEGDGLYPETGAVSPDGSILAVTYLEQPGSIRYTTTASTDAPEEKTKLTDSHVLGWTQ